MKLLVLTSEPVSAEQIRGALGADADLEKSEVMVVAPALQRSGVRFWMSDSDEAIEKAQAVGRQTREQLESEGVAAESDTGEADPYTAVQDALQTFPADRLLVFSRRDDEKRYREEVDHDELEIRFGLPVDQAELPA